MSSAVVPPTNGLKTWLDSPKTPWHDAHLPSHTSCPLATLPAPAGSPLKSGRTSMSHAATSCAVAARPIPGYLCCAKAPETAHANTSAIKTLGELDILDLAAFLHQPGLDGVVVIDRPSAPHGAQLPIAGLHIAGFVDGAR